MSRHAVKACALLKIPRIALERAPWTRGPGDRWIEVENIETAVDALPEESACVFLAIGRQHLAPFAAKPQHAYTLSFVDPPNGAWSAMATAASRGGRISIRPLGVVTA